MTRRVAFRDQDHEMKVRELIEAGKAERAELEPAFPSPHRSVRLDLRPSLCRTPRFQLLEYPCRKVYDFERKVRPGPCHHLARAVIGPPDLHRAAEDHDARDDFRRTGSVFQRFHDQPRPVLTFARGEEYRHSLQRATRKLTGFPMKTYGDWTNNDEL